MIKFFRKIRQNLLSEGRTGRYIKYAIGEIILVVIGILIALQFNNWNEFRKSNSKGRSFLNELRKNVESDMNYFLKEDTIFARYESRSERALAKFLDAKDYQDLLLVDSLFLFQWGDWTISRSVYDEMINTGSLYTLKNDKLKDRIANYYTLVDSRQYALKKINDMSIKLSQSSSLYQLYLLRSSDGLLAEKMEDDWIGDPNSTKFIELYEFYAFTQFNCNIYRRRFVEQILLENKKLLEELDGELGPKMGQSH